MDQRSPLNKDGEKVYDKDFLMALRNLPKSKLKPDNILKDIMAMDDKSENVKLHETENPWKPTRLNDCTTDEDKTEELYRKVRGVLNKLTPQKFTTLISQIKTLPIDTSDRLQGVIDLVFKKAVDEPNFSVQYALMCRELALIQVPISAESKMESVNFRKLLVTRCQMEFEKNSTEEGRRNKKLKEIKECADPEKKKELNIILDEDDRRIRMKSVGNVRFIGELFKQQMLTINIIVRCLYNLVENRDEERLECLCKLLTTVGKELETKKVDLGRIFGVMKDIADDKKGKVSSRVRFMLQDVIDLRNGSWVPRRQDLNPRTIDQIQKEAENEHLNLQRMNSGPMTPRKDDRNSGLNVDRNKRGVGVNRNVSNDSSCNKHENMFVASEKVNDNMGNRPMITCSCLRHRSKRSQRSKPTPMQQTQMKPPAPLAEPKLASEKMERMIKNIIDEYINDCCSLEDTHNDIKNSLPLMMYEQFVEDAYNTVLDRSRTARIKTGNLFAQLMKKETLQLDSYCNALVKVFSKAEDLIIDIPNLWDYYAELIYAPVSELVVPLNSLHKCTESIISMGYSHKLLASLFKVVIVKKGPKQLLRIWTSSNLSFNDWMAAEQVDSFISSNRFEFLVGSNAASIDQTSIDDVNKWINETENIKSTATKPNRTTEDFTIPSSSKRKEETPLKSNIELMKVCQHALERKETTEYEAVGINVSKKLEKMEHSQAIYAESLISCILSKGLLNQLSSNTSVCEKENR